MNKPKISIGKLSFGKPDDGSAITKPEESSGKKWNTDPKHISKIPFIFQVSVSSVRRKILCRPLLKIWRVNTFVK